MNSENVETWHGIIISPTQHVQKSGSQKKLDALRVQTGQTLSEYQGFRRELICYTSLHFLNLFEIQTFFCVPMHHSKRPHQFSTLSHIICYFQSFTDFLRELNKSEIENHYKMNSEKVETWHGIIISPTWHVKKSREGYGKKLDALRVQNGQSLSKYQGFIRKLTCYKGILFF